MKELYDSRAAADVTLAMTTDAPVLVTAGMLVIAERLARTIHAGSTRRAGPFIVVDCASRPAAASIRSLLESPDRPAAGTVCCIGIQNADAITQQAMARLTEARQMRVIAAATAMLHERVRAGLFSEMLFYRLNVIHVCSDTLDAILTTAR